MFQAAGLAAGVLAEVRDLAERVGDLGGPIPSRVFGVDLDTQSCRWPDSSLRGDCSVLIRQPAQVWRDALSKCVFGPVTIRREPRESDSRGEGVS